MNVRPWFFTLLFVPLGMVSGWSQEAPSESEPTLLFKLDFENGFHATAKGDGTPTNQNQPDLVDGISGKGALFEEGRVLRYFAKNNLNKRRGTMSMWVQSPITVNRVAGDSATDPVSSINAARYTLFKEDGANVRGGGTTWLWLNGGGPRLRFDVRDPKDQYLYVAELERWKKGEWHHVAATWDVDQGTQVYLDGVLMGERQIPKWEPKVYEAFFLGALDAAGIQSWKAVLDEVTIHDRPLTHDQIRHLFLMHRKFKVGVKLLDPYASAGKSAKLRVMLQNPDAKVAKVTHLRFELIDQAGKNVLSGELPDQVVEQGKNTVLDSSVVLINPGAYRFLLNYSEAGSEGSFEETFTVVAEKESLKIDGQERILVTQVDAAKTAPLARNADGRIIESPLGAYREAGMARRDRFALGFDVIDVDTPHLAVITYPDDKPRTMEVILQDLSGKADYQAQTGVFTGDEYSLSGQILEHSFVFWPRSSKQSLIFMTAENGHPAAVKEIKIYRLSDLPATLPQGSPRIFSGSIPARNVGLYYEDPVLTQNFGQSPGRVGFERSTGRLLDYMQSFGQNLLTYPVAWYNGPLYGTQVEPRQPDIGGSNAGDRPHPNGFPAYLLKRLAARGMKFNAGLHMHWLPSLNPYTITSLNRVNAGEETVVNVRGDGALWWGHWHGEDPNYNATDPRVMAAVKDVVDEITNRYGDEPAFEGVTLVLARNKLFQFGSIESGYNDVNLVEFQKDTGIMIPGYGPQKANRFAESYEWLKQNPHAMKAWVDWRCRKLHAHYKDIADSLSAKRADLKLTLNVFLLLRLYGQGADYLAAPPVEILRESGIDPALYANDPNIVMSYTLVPADFRWRRSLGEKPAAVVDNRTMVMAPEMVESYRALPQTGVTIHDRYWEDAIGRQKPLKGLSADPSVHECGWRVSTLNGASYHAMEPYVAALNNFDALEIAKGGFLIGTFGMEKELGAFSASYRALPAIKFEDVKGVEDPVRVRQKVVDGKLYFYALNRLPEPVTLKIRFNGKYSTEEPISGEKQVGVTELTVNLAPFGLRTFRADSKDAKIIEGRTTVSEEWIKRLGSKLDEVKGRVNASPYLSLAEKCWDEKQVARLYYLLQESWAVDPEEVKK